MLYNTLESGYFLPSNSKLYKTNLWIEGLQLILK
jgi:hypothetical protein